ncbi:hypothetical protein ACFQS1_20780 [Paractinoplanes rhizophilus]|jgi:hypothetical protein|uniref:Uncharacterized protein n=1 Tax=Paractinoplanes rhizophilus TaxID=1416877 RepID=A0ABW2HWF1_9ACTN|nr:hypothetical protein [Actinoplanes sp.]
MADVGSVSSWVSSGLTSASLALAAFTYFRAGEDRRRSQVARVSIWWINPRRALVRNSNEAAVTVQALVPDTASSERLELGPGETRGLLLPASLDGRAADVALTIVDSYARSWIRRGGGSLKRISKPGPPPETARTLRWEDR